jgi:uncharacterized membrane protein
MPDVAIWSLLTPLDAAALAYFILVIILYRFASKAFGQSNGNLAGAIQGQRVAWMQNMARRGDNRVLDVILVNGLSQGNAFFASTTAIVIGGLAAVMGSGDRAQAAMERLPFAAQANPILWDVKVAILIGVFVFAFFKFAWAFRLTHYTLIMIGATPAEKPDDPASRAACDAQAAHVARLAGLAGEHSNSGLRAFYYAIALLSWFYHPIAFLVATTWVSATMARRDFFSRSLRVIASSNADRGRHSSP